LVKIFDNIDQTLQAAFKNSGLKAYGLCELVEKDKKPNPVSVEVKPNKTRELAQIHDRYDGIFSHRIVGGSFTDDDDFTFGKRAARRFSGRARTVLAYKIKLGEDFIFSFVNTFPDRVSSLSEYKFVHLSQGTLIADHEAVYIQEYGNNSYEKHRTSWNIYAFEYDIEFILC
jgi:hypothetical protein